MCLLPVCLKVCPLTTSCMHCLNHYCFTLETCKTMLQTTEISSYLYFYYYGNSFSYCVTRKSTKFLFFPTAFRIMLQWRCLFWFFVTSVIDFYVIFQEREHKVHLVRLPTCKYIHVLLIEHQTCNCSHIFQIEWF